VAKTEFGCVRALEAETATGGPFGVGSNVRLFDNDFTPDTDTVIGDLVEASFVLYAMQPLVPIPPVIWVSPFASAVFTPVMFTNGDVVDHDVYGWYITDFTGALMAAGRFAAGAVTIPASSALPVFPFLQIESF